MYYIRITILDFKELILPEKQYDIFGNCEYSKF